jgi:hypothetical protein
MGYSAQRPTPARCGRTCHRRPFRNPFASRGDGMGSTGTAPLATIHNQEEMLDALRMARVMRGLSNDFCDERGGLTRGHVDKVLGPSQAKPLSGMVFDTLTALFAVKFIMVRDLEAEALMEPKWEGRDTSNVRTGEHRVGKYVLERARPKLLQEFGARLALAFGDDLDQVVAGIAATRSAPLPAAKADDAAAIPALPPPSAALLAPPPADQSPQPVTVEVFLPLRPEPVSHSHLRVVQIKSRSRFG